MSITNDHVLGRGEVIIKDTHRGLWFEDGVVTRAGLPFIRRTRDEIELVDVRERELTIKGQEILTADKVAIRVSILVEFRVTEPPPRYSRVSNYEDRLY